MIRHNKKILLLFKTSDLEQNQIQQKIRKFIQIKRHQERNATTTTEWYIVFVQPEVPAYAIGSTAILNKMLAERQKSKLILHNLGRILDISSNRRFLLEGNPDIQAMRLAKKINAQIILGHSKTYLKWRHLQSRLTSLKDKVIHFLRNVPIAANTPSNVPNNVHFIVKH